MILIYRFRSFVFVLSAVCVSVLLIGCGDDGQNGESKEFAPPIPHGTDVFSDSSISQRGEDRIDRVKRKAR